MKNSSQEKKGKWLFTIGRCSTLFMKEKCKLKRHEIPFLTYQTGKNPNILQHTCILLKL